MRFYHQDLDLEVTTTDGDQPQIRFGRPHALRSLTAAEARWLAHSLERVSEVVDPPDAAAEAENEEFATLIGERTDYVLRVDGTTVVSWFLEDKRAKAHKLMQLATDLGLQVFYRAVIPGDHPDQAPLNERWTFRRVTTDALLGQIYSRPGIKFTDLLERLYAEPNWSPQAQRNARGKLRTALFRLRHAGRAVQRFDDEGVERWQAPNLATGLRLSPAGPSAPRPDERGLPLTPLTEDVEAGAAVLRRYNIFSAEAEARDPTLYHDLVRQVLQGVLQRASDPRESL